MTPDSWLERNLAALARRDRALAERLCWAVDSSHVAPGGEAGDAEQRLQLRVQQTWYPLELSDTEVDLALRAADQTDAAAPAEVFVFGAGTGEMAARLLARDAGPAITLWDRDPFMLRLTLSRADWGKELISGRLRPVLGADLFAELERLPAVVVFHPLLAQIYRNERALLTAAPDRRALICSGGLFVDDVADALRASGHAVYTLDAARLSVEELALTVRVTRPVLLAAINYTEGLAEFCESEAVPLVCWEVDPSLQRLAPVMPPPLRSRIFTYRRAHVADYRRAGFPHAEFLPLAANPARRAPVPLSAEEAHRFAVPVAFVGASMADRIDSLRAQFIAVYLGFRSPAAEDAGAAAAARAQAERLLDQLLARQRTDFDRYLIPALLAETEPDFRAHCQGPGALDAEQIAGELAAGEKRLALLGALAAADPGDGSRQVNVWGDQGWRGAPAVRYRGVAGHLVELNKIYATARVNLDIGRLYQMDIVTMRVFDVLACGGFLLTERSPALAELFRPGHDLDVFTGIDELIDKTRYYLGHPALAARIAAQGRATVMGKHTVAQRLSHMLAALPGPG